MFCLNSLNLVPSEYIALTSALVALLSALYARRTWVQARRSNELVLLQPRKEIYDAFITLKEHMVGKYRFALKEEVIKFSQPSKNAAIYFEPFASEINDYYQCCLKVSDLEGVRLAGNELSEEENEQITLNLKKSDELVKILEKELQKVLSSSVNKSW